MKQLITLLLICSISLCNCSVKQKQFLTTLTVTDSLVTDGQIDTAALVLQKRLVAEKAKGVLITPDYNHRQLTIRSSILDKDWITGILLKKGALEFYECFSIYELVASLKEADRIVAEKLGKANTDTISNPLLLAFDNITTPDGNDYNRRVPSYIGIVSPEKMPLLKKYLEWGKAALPAEAEVYFKEQVADKTKRKYYEIYFLKQNDSKFFASNHVKQAVADYDGKNSNVKMSFDAYGTFAWERMTTKNVNKPIAIVIDGKIITVPTVIGPIEGGVTILSGVFEKMEANDMANLLQSGYMPLNLKIKSVEELTEKK